MKQRVYQFTGLNLKVNPLSQNPGDLLRSVNVDSFPIGAKSKRPGYGTYLGTLPNGSNIVDLMTWQKNNGTQFWNYAFGGGNLYYSTQGTGAWTICGNGTFSPLGTLTSAVLEDTLYICDGVGTINYSTTGTSFINNGTVLYDGTNLTPAPVAVSLLEYHQRIFAAGTASNVFWSNVGTGYDWTNDSSSVLIPNGGKLLTLFKSNDRLVATKNSGRMYRYDERDLQDLATNLGPTSTRSIADIENFTLSINNLGIYNYGGNNPELLSNPIERQIYNNSGSAIAGTTFNNAPGVAHQYKYYLTIGSTTDDLTDEQVTNASLIYDMRLGEWSNYSFAHQPSAWLSYIDNNGNPQLVFASGNQCYQMSGTATSDAGSPIASVIQGVSNFDTPELDKEFRYVWASFNPGAQARVQVAIADTFTKGKLNWMDLGDCSDGIAELRFPAGSRGKLLFWRVTESSATTPYSFYGFTVDFQEVPAR